MAHLIVLENGREIQKIALSQAPITIGRGSENTLTLPDTRLSRHHCRVLPLSVGGHHVVDLGSSNGTRLNGKRVKKDHPLHHDDKIELGRYVLVVHDPSRTAAQPSPESSPESSPPPAARAQPAQTGAPRLVARGGPVDGKDFPLSGVLTLGRTAKNDIALDVNEVSGNHAKIEPGSPGFTLTDLGSTNGTRVNGNLVRSRRLVHGDEIELGPVRLLFLDGASPEGKRLDSFRKRRMARDRSWALVSEDGSERPLGALPFTVGRAPESSLSIDDGSVSTHHAAFDLEGSHLVLEDVGSTNGTFVNGQKVDRARVGHGDEIEFGGIYYVLRDVDYPLEPKEKPSGKSWWISGAIVAAAVVIAAVVVLTLLGEKKQDAPDRQQTENRLAPNGSFEAAPGADGVLPGWSLKGREFSLERGGAPHGQAMLALKLAPASEGFVEALANHEAALNVDEGKSFTIGARVKSEYATGVAGVGIAWEGKGDLPFTATLSDLVTGDTDWITIETPVTPPPGARKGRVFLLARGSGGAVCFDDVRVSPAGKIEGVTIQPFAAGSLKGWVNRRGMLSVDLADVPVIRAAGMLVWDRKRNPIAYQESCLTAKGYPKRTSRDFMLRAEAVKLAEGLSVPFEVIWDTAKGALRGTWRLHADRGFLSRGDRIVLVLPLGQGVSGFSMATPEGEETRGRESFGSLPSVSKIRLDTGEGEVQMALEPAMTFRGLTHPDGALWLYASVPVQKADLGKILEISVSISPPAARKEGRAEDLLERANEQIALGRLGRAASLYAKIEQSYPDVADAVAEARARRKAILAERDLKKKQLAGDLVNLEAGPLARAFSSLLFKIAEYEALFEDLLDPNEIQDMRDRAYGAYAKVGGEAFIEARQLLEEAQMAYEAGDWVRAEALLARIISELKDEALEPRAHALYDEIHRRQSDTEEVEAYVEERLREAKDLESRGETETAREVYRALLKRYPKGEWAAFAKEQLDRLDKNR